MSNAPGASPLLRAGAAPLVGRVLPMAALAARLAEVRLPPSAGRPTVILLAGSPGIGKSRLLEALPPPELAVGVLVLRGGASQAAGMPPYLPFLHALGDYVASAPLDRLREQLGPHAPTLSPLFPELAQRLGPLPAPHQIGPEQERFRLYEAVAAFVAALAAPGPLLLILDDLQWADAASCDLLVHVAGRLHASPLLIVGAYRDGEAAENPALVRALAELHRRRLLLTLQLQPLEPAESGALVAGLLHADLAVDAADLLHRHSEGNPFFLEELLRALVDQGALVWRDRRWELGDLPASLLPPQVAEAIRVRVNRLDPAVVELLGVAALVGRASTPALLASVAGLDAERVEERLLAATRAQVLRPAADGSYAFTHDMLRETIVADIGEVRRRRLHQAIGETLEQQRDDGSPHTLADLAFHFAAAREPNRGAAYALAAGAQSLRASAAVEAQAHFRAALRLLGPAANAARRAGALMGLGDAATLAGDYGQAAEAYDRAQEAYLHSGDTAAAARAWLRLGQTYWRREAVAAAHAAFERAQALLGPGDSPDVAEALLRLADINATSRGRTAEGNDDAERALAMAQRLGDRHLQATAACVIGNVKARGNDLVAGQTLLERALALARELDDPALGAEACAYLANVYAWMANLARSRELSLLRAELAGRTHDLFHLRHVYAWIGNLAMIQGRWDEAERWYTQQEGVLQGLQAPEPHATLLAYRGALRYLQGRFAEADHEFRRVVELLRPTGSGTLVWHLGWRGLVLAELERADEARACYAELHALVAGLDERARVRGLAFAHLAVGYFRVGEIGRAAACYDELLPFAGQCSPILIDRALGLAAIARDDHASARRHLADAAMLARQADMRPELALALVQHGLLERPANAPGAALAEGLRLCDELGMGELARRALDIALHPAPGSAPRTNAAGLSGRELEVLGLVAQGKTNREIAVALVLSEKTVARHMTNIFTKTGVENRAGAAAFALRQGLA